MTEQNEMPRCHEVHSDPQAKKVAAAPLPAAVAKTPVEKKSPARWAYERIIIYLQNFEQSLDNEHEAAMGFAGGDAGVLRIEGRGYFDPDIITFYGTDATGARTQLAQHVCQLSVMFRALPKAQPDAVPNRIGFRLVRDLEEGDTAPV